jgi:hypothetical protein
VRDGGYPYRDVGEIVFFNIRSTESWTLKKKKIIRIS